MGVQKANDEWNGKKVELWLGGRKEERENEETRLKKRWVYSGKDENKEDGWKEGSKEIEIEEIRTKSCKERRNMKRKMHGRKKG